MATDSGIPPKVALIKLCERYTGKVVNRGDITYTVAEYDQKYQATVKLGIVDNLEFAGELASNARDAEQESAVQAMKGLESDITAAAGGRPLPAEEPDFNLKAKLREACKQILKRDLAETEIVYDVVDAPGGSQATVTLPDLPGPLSKKAYKGTVSPYKRDTILEAAQAAFEDIKANPELSALLDLQRIENTYERKGGKGWGKGKGKGKWGSWDMQWMMMGWYGKGGKGKGKGPRKPSGPDLPREIVSESPVGGEVLEWKGKYGWIKLDSPVEHEKSGMNGGRVYVNVKDLPEGVETLNQGDKLHFQVYVDSSGLGAQAVTVA